MLHPYRTGSDTYKIEIVQQNTCAANTEINLYTFNIAPCLVLLCGSPIVYSLERSNK